MLGLIIQKKWFVLKQINLLIQEIYLLSKIVNKQHCSSKCG